MPKPNVRDRLLAAGLATLHRRGFNATSVQDITEAAGVPKGSFYNHFASKEILGAEALKLFDENSQRAFDMLRDPSIAPLERLRRHLEAMNDIAAADGLFPGCLIGNFSSELSTQSPLIRETAAHALQRWTGAVADTIAAAQRSGDISPALSPGGMAAFIINAWEGSLIRAKAEQDRAPLTLLMSVIFTDLLRRPSTDS